MKNSVGRGKTSQSVAGNLNYWLTKFEKSKMLNRLFQRQNFALHLINPIIIELVFSTFFLQYLQTIQSYNHLLR